MIERSRGRFFPKAGGTADNQFIRPGILTMYSGVFYAQPRARKYAAKAAHGEQGENLPTRLHSPGIPHQKRSDHYEQHLQRHHIGKGKRGRHW